LNSTADETKKAIDQVEAAFKDNPESYELRLLRLPSIARTDVLWLKHAGTGGDLVIPIASRSTDVVAGQTYSAEEFISLLRRLASQDLQFDNRPRS